MVIRDTIKMSLKNLRINKMRSFLTMLGIIIGISSVILITSVVAGAESLIVNQVQGIGSNLIGVLPGASEQDGPPAAVFGIVITSLKDDDVEEIKEKLPHIIAGSAYLTATEIISAENVQTTVTVFGVSPDYPNIAETSTQIGNFFVEEDKASANRVVVLGSEVLDNLFPGQDALGKKIKINKDNYTVVGVMKSQGVVGFQNVDNAVFIPITTAQKRLLGINYVGFARFKVDKEENIAETVDGIKIILRERHNIDNPTGDDFTVENTAAALEVLGSITGALNAFLVAIAGISLIVGGIGIMNIMLAAVTERIKEIGLRKAVGATSRNIITQFLIETVVITLTGAVIGMLIGIFLAFIISIVINSLGYNWNFVITFTSIAMSSVFSIAIAIVFGVYPAKKAASYNPIEALRYE
ncbi:hypothetical protein A2533_02875 [Candidatus Falkowbacteria bacterium RIFOXYD2_FULL_35_9]|uniref:Multidrug ABC transporter substrate-binding protein n=1 Tax=Candidatus Falkowbacteria bacterium RIFOXYC2_FULL_36_12 TaxID=1798002 RepID=A0A1F5SYN2_9BACT|nr:MAG: hypothetical protein A2300_03200 [Candidatus Falkowbacteria bacterium RIFOXYB2_FULL_35_7]OGF31824.1 MAG: hypothetical protein A2478_05065 [Candidatus Falkowbacteria bacterium RIFOXYC2_FULL_36_12]OGF33768.1 MAG: hypothetical protein A2223_00125 [Candidatus Falkowbacteria bacterium RIFOXYA2_FULL_35_8]OGF46300.1 MAG: hypothetical protein A2533_02875 [Candidatus Falkowbacteria bacterium RIFOXYD2_FULL_35_9]